MTRGQHPRQKELAWIAFFVAAGVLGFEVSLLRVLAVASWHHFSFLVISIALLGFGASGTALFIFREWLVRRAAGVMFVLVLASGVSMPIAVGIAQHIPIEARIVPALLGWQIAYWVLYWAVLGLPFFIGAAAIGLCLMLAGPSIARIYAANLVGSAVGTILATMAMSLVEPWWLPVLMAGTTLVGGVGPRLVPTPVRALAYAGCLVGLAGYLFIDPPRVRVDSYKYGAYVARLARQGAAKRIAYDFSPRSVVEAYQSDVLHDFPFLSVGATPPSLTVLVSDGHFAGSVLQVTSADEARVVDRTVMAFPYAMAPRHPRVALLGETGGANVWLSARNDATAIHVVQPDAGIVALLRGPLRDQGGLVLDLPTVQVVVSEPRHFVEHSLESFDLIQLVMLESSSAGSGGVGGLGQDHLVTIEGITACLRRLTKDGLLVVSRGIQTPPKDNLKLLATFVEALRRNGVTDPQRHIVIVRDYLAVCTVVQASPWTPAQVTRIRAACARRQLTPVWFPGIRTDELNRPDELTGPPQEPGDWYHHAVIQLCSPSAKSFIDSWPFDIRPPTDDRPFFLDFCKLTSVREFRRLFGDLWLTRTELAFMFVLAALIVIGVVAAALTILPLILARKAGWRGGWSGTAGYFASIGLAYLLLEITFLSRLTHWIGDPVVAAAVTIAGFLFFSGVGSLVAQSNAVMAGRLVRRVIPLLVLVGALELSMVGWLAGSVGAFPYLARCAVSLLVTAPLGFLMGFPMPTGLARLHRGAPSLVPWAWGINGFASVLAAPLATAIGMTWGFSVAGWLALALYGLTTLFFAKLTDQEGI